MFLSKNYLNEYRTNETITYSAFVCSLRVFSASANKTILDLHNSSDHDTKAEFDNCYKTCYAVGTNAPRKRPSETKSTGNRALAFDGHIYREDTLLLYYVHHTDFKGGSVAFRFDSWTSGEVGSLSPAPTVWICSR